MTEPNWADVRDLPVDQAFEYGTRHVVSECFGSTTATISVVEFSPGESGPLQVHTDPVEEYYLVLSGELDIYLGGEEFAADAGTIVFIPPGTAHKPSNNSSDSAVLVSFVTPDVPLDEHTVYPDA